MNVLRELMYFFNPYAILGRNHHGGIFDPNGHIKNEIERNLSIYTDNELREFLKAANEFKELVAVEMNARKVHQ